MSGPLELEITWKRGDKVESHETQTFFPVAQGRYLCSYCGAKMTVARLQEHYFPCRASWGDF